MKKSFFLLIGVLIIATSFGTSTILSPRKLNANQLYIPIGTTGQKISLMELSTIRMDKLETLTGKRMNFAERISFRVSQKKLKKDIAPDGTIESKKLQRLFEKRDGETGFHLGGFVLGLLLGLIGVLIAYLIKDDYKRNRVKWAWIGWAVWVGIFLILLAAGV